MAEKIESFRDLVVYQRAFALQQEVFEVTKSFPKQEVYSLTDQMRRASRSIGANLAEAWHKRRYVAHFVSKLTDADAEQAETQHWVDTSFACAYIDNQQHQHLIELCKEIGRMLAKPEPFCRRFAQ